MPIARLKFDEREITLGNSVTTLGRATDNDVSFPEDSNVSRYHAEIECRFGDFWLIDLGSSNGTTVNETPVRSDVLLNEGDQILLGGSSRVDFTFTDSDAQEEKVVEKLPDANAQPDQPETGTAAGEAKEAVPEERSSKMGWLLGAAGLLVGLAIISVVGAVLFSSRCGAATSACNAQAVITSPEVGDTISKPVKIEVETKNESCVDSAVFVLDGKEFASVAQKPFDATLNPAKHPRLADGFVHKLSIVLLDKKGAKISESPGVAIAFETREVSPPKSDKVDDDVNVAQKPASDQTKPGGGKVSVIETKGQIDTIMKQFSASSGAPSQSYRFSAEFYQEVQKKTAEYAAAGFFARASIYKDVINEAFVKEHDLDPALGYILAMSRTQFIIKSDAAGEGLWRMPAEFVRSNSYDQSCGENKSLSDPSQICAAKASSQYLTALVKGVFEGDVIYSVAAFGKPPQMAVIWKNQLPADRSDFWNVIRTPNERDQIVRFFAAAAVAQNPEKYGLKNDRPLSELYSFILRK